MGQTSAESRSVHTAVGSRSHANGSRQQNNSVASEKKRVENENQQQVNCYLEMRLVEIE